MALRATHSLAWSLNLAEGGIRPRVTPRRKVTHIFVVDTFEEHQFPVGALGVGLVLERAAELLHRYRDPKNSIQS